MVGGEYTPAHIFFLQLAQRVGRFAQKNAEIELPAVLQALEMSESTFFERTRLPDFVTGTRSVSPARA